MVWVVNLAALLAARPVPDRQSRQRHAVGSGRHRQCDPRPGFSARRPECRPAPGPVSASGNASGGSTLDSATRVGNRSGGANGATSGTVGGSVDAQLIGTDAVRDAAGRGVNTVGNVAGRVRDTAGAVGNRARGAVSNLTGRAANAAGNAAGSGSGSLSAAGGNGALSGNLALAGSGAAQGGAFPVNTGMVVNDAQGRAIGAVQSVRTNAQGAVERVLVKVGERIANLPAANFSGSGNVLVSAMGQGDVSSAAK